MADLIIRKAVREDCKEIMGMTRELAEFERMPNSVNLTEDILVRDGFDSDPPFFFDLIAEINDTVIGHALYFYSYSPVEGGRLLYLEDLYIKEQYRGKGYGNKLFDAVINVARESDCFCMQWCVLNWNEKALGFYQKKGAFDLTLDRGTHMYRIEKDQMVKLANTE